MQNFTDAAVSLQKSYAQLQGEVLRLRFELERTNRDLAQSVEENVRMRRYLGEILESLPCVVLVVGCDGQVRMANPAARRLLSISHEGTTGDLSELALPQEIVRQALDACRQGLEANEREYGITTAAGERTIALGCAVLGESSVDGSQSE